jgi:hypothetical protein
MGDNAMYSRPPDRWPEPIQEGHCLQHIKRGYWTKQAAHLWHLHISAWMEHNSYPAVNRVKTIFMKHQGTEFILHGLFIYYMMHVSASDELHVEFMDKYIACFNITGCGIMKTLLGMEVQQSNSSITLHFDHCIQETLTEYREFIKKTLSPKWVQILSEVILSYATCQEVADQHQQKKSTCHLWCSSNLPHHGSVSTSHLQCNNLHYCVHLQVHPKGQPYTT